MIEVKGVRIGEGPPKICVPMVGMNVEQLMGEADRINGIPCDLVEWRVDFFQQAKEKKVVLEMLGKICGIIPNKPILFTFRNKHEGGHQEITPQYYWELNDAVMETGKVDLVDVELFSDAELVRKLVKAGKRNKVMIIISNHDFHQTPSVEEMINRMLKAVELGADIGKIAVMPKDAADIVALQEATRRVKVDHGLGPLITIGMGGLGVVTRFSGEVFGSDMTFGALSRSSAPGQIDVVELRQIIELLHVNMPKKIEA